MNIEKKIEILENKVNLLTIMTEKKCDEFPYFSYQITHNLTKRDNDIIMNSLIIFSDRIKNNQISNHIEQKYINIKMYKDILIDGLPKEGEFEKFIKSNVKSETINIKYILKSLIMQNIYADTCNEILKGHLHM